MLYDQLSVLGKSLSLSTGTPQKERGFVCVFFHRGNGKLQTVEEIREDWEAGVHSVCGPRQEFLGFSPYPPTSGKFLVWTY